MSGCGFEVANSKRVHRTTVVDQKMSIHVCTTMCRFEERAGKWALEPAACVSTEVDKLIID